MIRLRDIGLLGIAVAGAVWTYQIKHEAELSAKHINTLKAQIAAQNRKINLLEADWAIETSPARLEKIAEQFGAQLKLKQMSSSQIIDTTELPGMRVDREGNTEEVFVGRNGELITGGIGDLIEKKEGN